VAAAELLDQWFADGGYWRTDDEGVSLCQFFEHVLSDERAWQFEAVVGAADTERASDLCQWLQYLATQPAAPEGAAGRYSEVGQVEDSPGWWHAFDTELQQWMYVRSDHQPDDTTQGWVPQDQATAMAQSTDGQVAGKELEELNGLVSAIIAEALRECLDEYDAYELISAAND
jgi:hypothetical protein